MMRVKLVPLTEGGQAGWIQLGRGAVILRHRWEPARQTLALPAPFLDQFGLIPHQDLHVFPAEGGQRLVIGPLIGIWISPSKLQRWKRGMRRLSQEARGAGALPFFFDLDGIDRARGRVVGVVAVGDQFRRVTMPLPDVLYNRATFADLTRRAAARALRQALIHEDAIPFVNVASGFPKWETYETLRFFAETRPLVPETIRFGDSEELTGFLARHRLAFVKSDAGSHGTEVLRLTPDGEGWLVEGQVGDRKVRTRAGDVTQLVSTLERWVGGSEWVVQQGIRLPRLKGRHWDLRIEVRKDGKGEWRIPLMVVRLGNPASVTTNISRGGQPFVLDDFRRRFGKLPHVNGLRAKAARVAVRVAFALEAR